VFRRAEHVSGQPGSGPAVTRGRQDQQQFRVPRAEPVAPLPRRRADGQHREARVAQVEFGAGRHASRRGPCLGKAGHGDQPSSRQRLEPAQAERREPRVLRVPLPGQGQPRNRRHSCRPGHPAVRVGDERGTADAGEQRCRGGTQRLEVVAVRFAQLALGHSRGGVDERERARMDRRGGTAQVDHAEQPAGRRVVDRGGCAGPGMVRLHEMFGRIHLNGVSDDERRPDRVRADARLAPVRAGTETEMLGVALYRPRAVPPQDDAVGVDDDHDVPRVFGRGKQHAAEHGQHPVQVAGVPSVLHLIRSRLAGQLLAPVGIDAEPDRAPPGVADDRARGRGRPVAGQCRVPDPAQQLRVADRILARRDRRFEARRRATGGPPLDLPHPPSGLPTRAPAQVTRPWRSSPPPRSALRPAAPCAACAPPRRSPGRPSRAPRRRPTRPAPAG
jgi:hypothetical protein